MPRGVHGSTLARSSITIATCGFDLMLRYFMLPAKLRPDLDGGAILGHPKPEGHHVRCPLQVSGGEPS
jgi:hypothetical protein